MKKDIPILKVKDIAIAIIPEKDNLFWGVYLFNFCAQPLDTCIVVSKGYGKRNGKKVKTSTLRHLFKEVPPNNYVKIELIEEKLFGISNEFWVSYWQGGDLYDKKYVFVRESISKDHFTKIPLINELGVMIK